VWGGEAPGEGKVTAWVARARSGQLSIDERWEGRAWESG
jgi:hypothetical protein